MRVHTAQNEYAAMPHTTNIVYCDGPNSPHALDIVPLQPRNGMVQRIRSGSRSR